MDEAARLRERVPPALLRTLSAPHAIIVKKAFSLPMASKSGPEMGVNSWLEDELYQQYLRDRSTVDESWKHLFETSNGYVPNGAPAVAAAAAKPAPALEPAPGEQLQPLRGAAGRI